VETSPLNEARKKELTPEELNLLNQELENRKKKYMPWFFLWFLLGSVGAHRFYLGYFGYGIMMLIQAFTLGPFTYGITTFIWWVADCYFSHKARKQINHDIEAEIIDRILAHRTAKAQ